jgi:hypothetical protein
MFRVTEDLNTDTMSKFFGWLRYSVYQGDMEKINEAKYQSAMRDSKQEEG